MAKTTLPTNYVDDVLNGAMDGKRRYREIPNADGTISLEDVTTYEQVGSNFGASQLNLMSDNINQSFDANKMLKTMDEVNAVTQEGYGVDALVVKQVNDSLGGLQFGIDENGNYGYIKAGADTVTPFSGKLNIKTSNFSTNDYIDIIRIVNSINGTVTLTKTSTPTPSCAIYSLNENGTIGDTLYSIENTGTITIELNDIDAPYGIRLAHTKANTSTSSLFNVVVG